MRILLVALLLALFPYSAFAATCTVTSGTGAAMFSALQTCIANAVDGDEIVVQAGTVNFTSGISINNKLLTIRGAGPSLTTFQSTQASSFQEGIMFTINLKQGNFTLRDFTVVEGATSLGQSGMMVITGSSNGFWMDNIVWQYTRKAHTLHILGYVRGVISRLTMNLADFGTPIFLQHLTWGDVGNYGDNSWAQPTTFGTAEALYIEDSSFICAASLFYCANYDSDSGARQVLRRSTMVGPQYVNHGLATADRLRGTFQDEYYQNIVRDYFPQSSGGFHHPFPVLSGTGIYWQNSGTNLNTPTLIEYSNLRAHATPPSNHRPYSPWGDCGVKTITQISCSGGVATVAAASTASLKAGDWVEILGSHANYNGTKAVTSPAECTGSQSSCGHEGTSFTFAANCSAGTVAGGQLRSPFDNNTSGASGYRCMDQPGNGPGRLLSGFNAVNGLTNTTPAAQVSSPLYDFLNTLNGVRNNAAVHGQNDSNDIQSGRDYFSYTGSTSVTGGVGVGPIASRPACVTLNTAYWATDEGEWDATDAAGTAFQHDNGASAPNGADGQLYKCDGAGNWSLYYTPYTYPHPLRAGGAVNTTPSLTIEVPIDYLNQTAATVNLSGTCVDDTACSSVTWVNSNGGATTPLASLSASNWTVTGAAVNAGTNLFTFTGSDGTLTGQDTVNILRRATVSALPFTDDCSATVAWPNLGPHYTRYGTTSTYAGMASGRCIVNAAAFDGYAFTGFALNTNQYIKATIVTVSPFAQQMRLCVNMKGTTGQSDNFSGLWIQVDGTNSSSNIISRYVGGALDHVYVSGAQMGAITVVPGTTTIEARRFNETLTLLVDDQVKAVAIVDETINGVDPALFDGGTAGPCPYGVGTQWDSVEIGNTTPPPGDLTLPVVTVLVPAANYETADSTFAELSGTVTDNVSVASCTRDNNLIPGEVSITVGAGTFTAADVPVLPGLNIITVRCLDSSGNTGTAQIGVRRQTAGPPRLKRRPF